MPHGRGGRKEEGVDSSVAMSVADRDRVAVVSFHFL